VKVHPIEIHGDLLSEEIIHLPIIKNLLLKKYSLRNLIKIIIAELIMQIILRRTV